MKRVLIGLLAVMFLLPATSMAKVKDVTGAYSIRGYNPGFSSSDTPSYTGTLEITQSNGAYLLTWKVGAGGKQVYKGVGIYTDGILSAGFHGGKVSGGVVSYKVKKNVLKGVWAPFTGGPFGYEFAERKW